MEVLFSKKSLSQDNFLFNGPSINELSSCRNFSMDGFRLYFSLNHYLLLAWVILVYVPAGSLLERSVKRLTPRLSTRYMAFCLKNIFLVVSRCDIPAF